MDTYAANWRLWQQFRLACSKPDYLTAGDADAVDALVTYVGYMYTNRSNKLKTINCKLAAINHYHKMHFGKGLPMEHPWVVAAKKGVARSQGDDNGNVKAERLPLQWHMIEAGRQHCLRWQHGERCDHLGQVLWCGIALSYLLLARVSELFADSKSGLVHKEAGLLRSDLAFYNSIDTQLPWTQRSNATHVEIRFRASKGDQQRRGAVITRSGATLQVLLQLLQLEPALSMDSPLMAYSVLSSSKHSTTRVATSKMATTCLRHMVKSIGMRTSSELFSMHSGRIGGATALAAAGLSDSAIMAAGRWKSDAYQVYPRASRQEASNISAALTSKQSSGIRTPGTGTSWWHLD